MKTETQARLDFIETILLIFDTAECRDELMWTGRWADGVIRFSAQCSDIFEWATADAEGIETEQDIDLLRQCLAELSEADQRHGRHYLAELYAARKRHQRPQGAWFAPERWAHVSGADAIRQLFLDAGPERSIDLFNPQTTEGVYEYGKAAPS
jgi:hypothetical protein